MRYGYFDDAAREYVIDRPDTPAPWVNYLGSPEYGAIISNHAGGYSFAGPVPTRGSCGMCSTSSTSPAATSICGTMQRRLLVRLLAAGGKTSDAYRASAATAWATPK